MSVNSAVAQGHAQGSIGASGQFPTQSTATGNNYDFPAPSSMTKDFATFIPMPQGGHSGLTAKQASIIMKAFTKSVLDRNTAVLDGLRPDAEELKKHMDSIRVWEAALGSQPPEKIRLALADNAGEGDTKSVAECLQRDSFKVIERANKILRVLYLERTHSPARAKSMDNIESQVKEDMNEVQRILGRALSTLNMKYPPGAEFGLTPHRDVKLYEGAPLLFYPEHPENPDEDGELKGEWYVAEFDHPVVAAPGTPWNKWIKNWADSDSNMTTIKLPPIARALLSEIKGNYHKAFVQFIRSEPVRSGEVQMKPPVRKEIDNYRLFKKFLKFKGHITHHLVTQDIDCHGDRRFSEFPIYDPRGDLQLEAMNMLATLVRGRGRPPAGMTGTTMMVKMVDFMEPLF